MPLTCTAADARFLSTPSGWRATQLRRNRRHGAGYFYPRPPGGGRRNGGDAYFSEMTFLSTPSGWRATCSRGSSPADLSQFLSTPSGWRATRGLRGQLWAGDDFYPRPPGGGRLSDGFIISYILQISIHALRVEGDAHLHGFSFWRMISIHALRVEGDMQPRQLTRRFVPISIHALRVEGDPRSQARSGLLRDFYPRPPGGGRHDTGVFT